MNECIKIIDFQFNMVRARAQSCSLKCWAASFLL
jgi:hypothetical protein